TVPASRGRLHRVITVQRVWQGYVDGVHIVPLKTLPELVVVVCGGLELSSDELGLGAIAGNDGNEPRIPTDRCKGRKHGGARNHPEPEDCESDLLCHALNTFCSFCPIGVQARGHWWIVQCRLHAVRREAQPWTRDASENAICRRHTPEDPLHLGSCHSLVM